MLPSWPQHNLKLTPNTSLINTQVHGVKKKVINECLMDQRRIQERKGFLELNENETEQKTLEHIESILEGKFYRFKCLY